MADKELRVEVDLKVYDTGKAIDFVVPAVSVPLTEFVVPLNGVMRKSPFDSRIVNDNLMTTILPSKLESGDEVTEFIEEMTGTLAKAAGYTKPKVVYDLHPAYGTKLGSFLMDLERREEEARLQASLPRRGHLQLVRPLSEEEYQLT